MPAREVIISKKTKGLMARKDRHSDETRYKVVVLHSQLGSLRQVATVMGMSYQTLKEWHTQDWWKSIEDDLASQKKTKLSGQIEKVRDKAVSVVEDRLDNGDYFYDQKVGELVRRPVSADSAARILNTTLNTSVRLEELRQNEKRIETVEKTQDRLNKLKEEFARFAKATQIEGKYNAIPEERKEELSSGAGLGEGTREGTSECEGEAEPSPSGDGEEGRP